MMRRRNVYALAGLWLAFAMLVTACSSSGSEETASSGGNEEESESTGSKDCVDGPITVGIIPKLGDDPYMTTVRDGAQKAADEIGEGDKVVYTEPSEATGAAQIPFVQQLVSQKVDVIAISGSDLDGAAAELKKAREQGIEVISFDSDVAPDARSLFINQAETVALGTAMLDSMSDLLEGEGQFAILSSTQTAVNQNAWIADIERRLEEEEEFANLELVDIVYGEEKADVSANRAVELVNTHPDLEGIIVPAGISLPAAATALEDSGDLGRVKVTGLAPVSLIREYIQGGDVQDIWWNVTDLGYLTMHAAKAVASCEAEGVGDSFESGELGEYSVGENGVVILGDAELVTPENESEFVF